MHPLERLEFSTRVVKRAQYEAFAFAVCAGGVLVRNCSYAEPAAHEYVVTVADGLPVRCECPADDTDDGACKHRVAVAIRPPVLEAADREESSIDGVEPAVTTPGEGTGDDEGRERGASTGSQQHRVADCSQTGRWS